MISDVSIAFMQAVAEWNTDVWHTPQVSHLKVRITGRWIKGWGCLSSFQEDRCSVLCTQPPPQKKNLSSKEERRWKAYIRWEKGTGGTMLTVIDHLCKEDRSPSGVSSCLCLLCIFVFACLHLVIIFDFKMAFFFPFSITKCLWVSYITLMYDYYYYSPLLTESYLLSGHLYILHPVSRWKQFSGLMQRLQVVGHQR